MKKQFFILAACAAALLSCNKEGKVDDPVVVVGEGKKVEVTVTVTGSSATKAMGANTGMASEDSTDGKVTSVQVFAFDGEGNFAGYGRSSRISTLVETTAGERTFWAIVNVDKDIFTELAKIDAEGNVTLPQSAIESYLTTLDGNALDKLVMTGSATETVADGGRLSISVRRTVARVQLNNIMTTFRGEREGYYLKIKHIYLINVAGDAPVDISYKGQDYSWKAPTAWVNKLSHEDAAYDELLADDLVSRDVIVKNNVYEKAGVVVPEDAAYADDITLELADGVSRVANNSYGNIHAYYPYPNPHPGVTGFEQTFSPTWAPRGTLLVLEVSVFDSADTELVNTGYYPIALPTLERNKVYTIGKLAISKMPTDVPYKPIDTDEAMVTITVDDWELGELVDVHKI